MAGSGHRGTPDIDEARLGKVLVKAVLATTPVALIIIFVTVLFTTDQSVSAAIGSSILPGILAGVFGGGFIGMIIAGD